MNICIAVLNTFVNDARVQRTVDALSECNNITIVAESYERTGSKEWKDNDFFFFKTLELSSIKFLPFRFIYWQLIKRIQLFLFTYKIFKSDNFNILYCNDLDSLIALYPLKTIFKIRIIYDTHELWTERTGANRTFIHRLFNHAEKILENRLIHKADCIITASQGISDELQRRYGLRGSIPIRNLDKKRTFPDQDSITKLRQFLSIPKDCTLIVHWGTLIESRGIPELIEAMDLLPDTFHLLLIGKCSDKNIRENIDTSDKIHFPGFIPSDNLFKYTAIADIGIVPYKTKGLLNYFVTFPNKFSQFMNARLALILYDSIESRKIINRCDCGLILDEISPEHIAKKVITLTQLTDLNEVKDKSRKCFLNYYNWDIDRYKLIKLINGLI